MSRARRPLPGAAYGRYTLSAEYFQIDTVVDLAPRFSIAPSQVVTMFRALPALLVAEIPNRRPVILASERYDQWLDPQQADA